MKSNINKSISCLAFLLGIALVVATSCKEEFYTIDKDFYKDKTVTLKNQMTDDTLFIELDNKTDRFMLEEPNNPDITFDNRGFLFTVHDATVVTIDEEGSILPVSLGVTQVDIVSRVDKSLRTSIFVQIYKQYVPVDEIQQSPEVKTNNSEAELNVARDLSKEIVVYPLGATNKKVHFSLSNSGEVMETEYASITDEGVITGLKITGTRNKVDVYVVSDDNPDVKTTFKIVVVTERAITAVNLLAGLDGAEIGMGEVIDLNLCASVTPADIQEANKKLSFELLEGDGSVLTLDGNGVITAVGVGTAKLKVSAKLQTGRPQQSAVFTINVKAGLTDLTRLLWTVTPSVKDIYGNGGYAPDGTTGFPQDMFDNNAATFFSMVKPGKSYNGYSTPSSHVPHFIVDMKDVKKFNYIRWNNRSGQGDNYLRVWGIDFFGSNDGTTWTTIKQEIELVYANNTATQRHPVPESEYRYVKVVYTKWSDNSGGSTSGNTLQVAEFGLGYE